MDVTVTACQLPDDPDDFRVTWGALSHHVRANATDVLVLNEAPFARWFARSPRFSLKTWNDAVRDHETAIQCLDLDCALIGTMPVNATGRRHNRAFSWTPTEGLSPWRRKAYIPDEQDVWEASWYEPVPDPPDVRTIRNARVGILTCTEIWRFEWASELGQMDAQMIVSPRATGETTFDKWLAAGRAAAISAGAFGVSSNRAGDGFGGAGWILSPDGDVLATTNKDAPFATVSINLAQADEAKSTYPRYAIWRS
jgi:N-carbamoylputrescine amidase